MSYHDGYDRPRTAGNAVVNPLLEQRKRLTKLEHLLKEIAEETTDEDLRKRIEHILENE